ncbi:hypothetical protein F5887DRAFT_1207435 [Amanita rubescens]|nr:hypothetical protein F5887DRAFT_1207435 [Amanita rubescens]
MKFTAFGSIIALALVGVVAAAGVPAQNPGSGKTPAQSPNTGTTTPNTPTTPNTSQDQCVQSDCTCSGSSGNFCGSAGSPNNCLAGHLYACQQGGKTCDLGLNDSCKN